MKDGQDYTLNELNQLEHDGVDTYVHDLNGRMTYNPKSQIVYTYDAMDRLLSATQGQKQTRYKYDFENRRLSKSHFVYSENQWKQISIERYFYQGKNEIGNAMLKVELHNCAFLAAVKEPKSEPPLPLNWKDNPMLPSMITTEALSASLIYPQANLWRAIAIPSSEKNKSSIHPDNLQNPATPGAMPAKDLMTRQAWFTLETAIMIL